MITSDNASFVLSLSNTLKAYLNFLSTDSWLDFYSPISQSFNCISYCCSKWISSIGSLFWGLIIVASPISCIAKEVVVPFLILLYPSSLEKDLHSGLSCSVLSGAANPHFEQNISQVLESVKIEPRLQLLHLLLELTC
jgi:hypothetical protein